MAQPINETCPLPVGVVIPTLNSRAHLPGHVASLSRWLPRTQEIVVVDSRSTDGTLEFLRENLQHPKAQFLTHPPGLYDSWNFGIRHISTEFLTIATVGDTLAPETLDQLAAIARQWNADVVLSRPRFSGPRARNLRGRWPIEQLIARRKLSEPLLLGGLESFLWTAVHVPGGLLGSSAGNLYRTRFMQEHPFPNGFRHAGDTGWAIENAFGARIVVAPGLSSEFLAHEKTGGYAKESPGETRRQLHRRAQEVWAAQLAAASPPECAGEFAPLLADFWRNTHDLLDANEHFHDLRREDRLAWVHPAVLRARWSRFVRQHAVNRCRAVILDRLESVLTRAAGDSTHAIT